MEQVMNPFQLWKKIYDYAEQNYSDSIQKNMQEEAFASWIGACQQWYLFWQDMQNKSLEQFLQASHLVSKDDLARVSSLVLQLEEKLENLEEKLDEQVVDELKLIRSTLDQIKATS